ncbi:helix-turn-helix domain-containing protein [Asanoa siamensis]|uniref:AraC family transcriptional regulator n=1 Tax=Asanoa siamensis TaxID=926357 RepID=A0ABQ4CLG7_9ACTN|nr:AraC family transcriptional regulator [Asanoa siamensis]GIF72129.1 AraC family transcriptional regulator [Asanoa siamensis]
MGDPVEEAAKRAIEAMRENLSEQITVDDMARAAMFSKFHFTRIFQRATGVSPGRFLSALRLQRAKYLLVSTSLNVAHISLRVGYNSVGTFSSRFSKSVGMSPTAYRKLAGYAPHIQVAPNPTGPASTACVHGQVQPADPDDGSLVFIGLFPDRVPEGRPVRCSILSGPGLFHFTSVPPGTWYLLAQSVDGDPEEIAPNPHHQSISVATHGPLTISHDTVLKVDVQLQPATALDPPVLLALLDARKIALSVLAAQEKARAVTVLPTRLLPRPAATRSAA